MKFPSLSVKEEKAREAHRNNSGATEISQFIVVLYILFLILLLPLIDLVNVFVGAAVQYLATNDIAAKAATQPDFNTALNTMVGEAANFQTNGLAKFVNLLPDGGYVGCGNDLYIVTTNLTSGDVHVSAKDTNTQYTINNAAEMYEMKVVSNYQISPLISFSAIPGFSTVPGLGQPATFSFAANRPVEQPSGLQAASNGSGSGSTTITPFTRKANPPTQYGNTNGSTWRTPSVYGQVKQNGQFTQNSFVVRVRANYGGGCSPWVDTGIYAPGTNKIWIDTSAVGQWGDRQTINGGPVVYLYDACGYQVPNPNGDSPNAVIANPDTYGSIPIYSPMALLGYVVPPNSQPPSFNYGFTNPPNGTTNALNANGVNPRLVPASNINLNWPVQVAGELWLACNNNQQGCTGAQKVRIIVTN